MNHASSDRSRLGDLLLASGPPGGLDRQIRELGALDAPVLVEGEAGTGKELVARAIHQASSRRGRPFVVVHTTGQDEGTLAAQLFGPADDRPTPLPGPGRSLFAEADGGTVFFAEIGSLPLRVQIQLSGVLRDRMVLGTNGSAPRLIDVRVVGATRADLVQLANEGEFDHELLYRMRVARIQLPPLRERLSDIPLLVDRLLGESPSVPGKSVEGVSEDVMRRFLAYRWPGNVSELRSVIEYAVLRCKGTVLEAEDLPPELLASAGGPAGGPDSASHDGARLLAALKAAGGNRTLAAKLMGVSRATLYRRIRELNTNHGM